MGLPNPQHHTAALAEVRGQLPVVVGLPHSAMDDVAGRLRRTGRHAPAPRGRRRCPGPPAVTRWRSGMTATSSMPSARTPAQRTGPSRHRGRYPIPREQPQPRVPGGPVRAVCVNRGGGDAVPATPGPVQCRKAICAACRASEFANGAYRCQLAPSAPPRIAHDIANITRLNCPFLAMYGFRGLREEDCFLICGRRAVVAIPFLCHKGAPPCPPLGK